MSNLYKDLAKVYETMYQTFIDYKEEYEFYGKILQRFQKKNVLEIGSGTGNLAQQFIENGYDYLGLDYSEDMIKIAANKVNDCKFHYGDMRNFKLDREIESTIITGRTISYLITNEDVNATFSTIYKHLSEGGILCFDFIDASRFIPLLKNGKEVSHTAGDEGTSYLRKSKWKLNLKNGMDFKWDSIYFIKKENQLIEIGRDNSIIRTFTQDEIEIFLSINGFEIHEFLDKESYAFPTYVVIAEKTN